MTKRTAIEAIVLMFAYFTLAASSLAQMTVVEESTDQGTRTIYKMTITPAVEPLPAFKYRFTVPPHKTINGNAITNYLRAFGEGGFDGWKTAGQEVGWEEFEKYFSLEPGNNQVDLEKLKRFSGMFDVFVDHHLRRATLCRDSDWGLGEEDLRGAEVIEIRLPGLQQMRTVSRMLALRTRLAIRENRFDDAVDHIRMNFKLGKNITETKFLVTQLVALAVCRITEDSVIELIATPGSPNLYWALAELPRPYISVRESQHVESSIPIRLFPILEQVLEDPDKKRDWQAELQQLALSWDQMYYFMHSYNGEPPKPDARNFAGLTTNESSQAIPVIVSLMQYTKAKKRLKRYDYSVQEIEAMPVAKVILLDTAFEVQRVSHELHKLICLGSYDRAGKSFYVEDDEALTFNAGAVITQMYASNTTSVKAAEIRLTWQLNALQNIEAIRMHAAEHGSLPKTLKDIKLHLPNNPFTKKPYEYRLRGKTAVLEMPFGEGWGAQRFELTLPK